APETAEIGPRGHPAVIRNNADLAVGRVVGPVSQTVGRGNRRPGTRPGAGSAPRLRGVGAGPGEVPRRPAGIPLDCTGRTLDRLRLPEGRTCLTRCGGAGEVLSADRLGHAVPLGPRLAGRVGRGRDAGARHWGVG